MLSGSGAERLEPLGVVQHPDVVEEDVRECSGGQHRCEVFQLAVFVRVAPAAPPVEAVVAPVRRRGLFGERVARG